MVTVEVKTVKLSSIKLNPDNPRRISNKDMDYLVKSLTDFPEMMQMREIVVDENYTVLGGNMRLLALKKIKLGECTAKIVKGLTEAQKREFIVKDNSSYGEYDFDILANLWSDLPLVEWGVNLPEDWLSPQTTGEPADAEPQIDKAEELNKTWKVKTGDLWQIGEHRFLCGDSTKAEDVARVMGGEKADMVHADPPYQMNLNTDFDSMFTADKRHRKTGKRFDAVIGDDGTFDISACMKACVDIGEQFWWGADYYRDKLPNGGGWYVWDKRWNDSGMDLDKVVGNCFELCWSKSAHKRLLFRVTWSGHHGLQGEDTKSRVHPNQKPTELITDLLRLVEGKIIYDPCTGSGTTMVACQNLNRKCRGIEISPGYCAVILQRMIDAFPGIEIKRIK